MSWATVAGHRAGDNPARSETVLAGEVLHVTIGSSPMTPWAGSPPLYRASVTAGLLQVVEEALAEVYRDAPIGLQIVGAERWCRVNTRVFFRIQRGARRKPR